MDSHKVDYEIVEQLEEEVRQFTGGASSAARMCPSTGLTASRCSA